MKINAAGLINDIKGFVDPASRPQPMGQASPMLGQAMQRAAVIPQAGLQVRQSQSTGPGAAVPMAPRPAGPQLQPGGNANAAPIGKLKLGPVEYHPAVGLHLKVLP